jgi:hypothetical protein
MKIVVVGQVCVDKNTSEGSSYTGAGGPAIFIDKIFKQFGNCQVSIISPYGADYQKYFQKINIYPKIPNVKKTLIYENVTKNQIRIQKAYNREKTQPIKLDFELEKILGKAEIIFFAPLLPNFSYEYIQSLTKLLNKNCLKILLPQGYFRAFDKDNQVVQRDFIEADSIISFFDFIICSDQDHKNIFKLAKEWSVKTKTIVTLGERGAMIVDENKKKIIPTTPVKKEDIVDSVGAGDTFSGAFAYQFQKTKNLIESIKFANCTARQKIICKDYSQSIY